MAAFLTDYCRQLSERHEVRIEIARIAENLCVDNERIVQLYRIAQEAVANAVRHARCTTITVELTRPASDLVLTITDDGTGLPASPARRPPGMGLHSMSHRAEAIGAFLSIHPRDGGGTVVRCALPEPTPAADSSVPRPVPGVDCRAVN